MTSVPAETSLVSFTLCLGFILLVPFAIAGLALINTGLGRSRSAAHAMTSALCVICVATFVYFVWGFRLQGYPFVCRKVLRGFISESGPTRSFPAWRLDLLSCLALRAPGPLQRRAGVTDSHGRGG